MQHVDQLRRFPLPTPVREYVELGDVLNANELPREAAGAIRAKRLELVSKLLPEHINVLGDIGQARSTPKNPV